MMKKFSISTQLLVLVFTLLLSTSIVFIIITYFSLQKVASEQAINRMYSIRTNDVIKVDTDEAASNFQDMQLYYIDYNVNSGYHPSKNALNYISIEEFQQLFENFLKPEVEKTYRFQHGRENERPQFESPEAFGFYRGAYIYKTNAGVMLYYSFTCNRDFTSYSFIFTDNTYASAFIRDVALRMFSTFLGILFIATMCIYVWSTRITRRLKNIQNHIIDLPKDKYEKEYVDTGEDEIGELSRSVEYMRKEIGHNENTKQEMLQNLSHDFKTPIAVIRNYAEAMDDEVEDPKVATKKIIEQADILKNKVNRLLQYNSLEYLSKDKEFEDILMNEIINDIVINYKHQLGDIKLSTELEEEVFFKGYKENWYTVVDNIVDNAKRYAKTEIKIILKKDKLIIYNDGDHLEDKFVDEIFKPYEKGSKGQFGLGMSIVQKTVNFFNMTLSAKNENVGVSFTIEGKNEL